ncbi:MAG: hypothetical protein AAB413_00755 [Patescibacteria group bacterium]
MHKIFYTILATLFLSGILTVFFLNHSSTSDIVIKDINCQMSPPRLMADTGMFRLPRKGREDGPMPIHFKDGSRDLWNTSTFCENQIFQNNLIGKPFRIEYNLFRTIRAWEEK